MSPSAAAALSWPLVAAVLGGALLHAGWNALIKSSGDKTLDTALVHFLAALVAAPLLLFATGLPPPAAWPWAAASLVVHVGYYIALAGAYRHGDLGFTYPIMRGFAPLLVALASGAAIGEVPTPLAWAGIAGIAAGVALVGLSHAGAGAAAGPSQRTALKFAFANAGIIALYTVIDGRGVRVASGHGGSAMAYVLLLFAFDGLPFPALVVWQRWRARGRAGLGEVAAYVAGRWRLAALGGIASIGSYAVALWAMTRAPVASVAALRETSVLFAALLGSRLLRERFGARRALGTGIIVAGVMALRLA